MTKPRSPHDERPYSRSTHVGVGAPLPPARAAEAAADAARFAPAAGPADQLAVIVAHGMGQQMHFETLEEVAEILRGAEERAHRPAPPVTVRIVRMGEKEFPRAEIRVTATDGRPRDVHLYESYWAPLTEGKVTTAETMWFLLSSGLRGMFHAGLHRVFERYMFDRPIGFKIPVHAFLQFFAAMVVIVSLLAINAMLLVVLTSRTVAGGSGSWVSDPMLADLTADLGLGLIGIVVGGALATIIPRLLRKPLGDFVGTRMASKWAQFAGAAVSAVAWLFMIAALGSIVATAFLMLWHSWRHVSGATSRIVDVPIVNAVFNGSGNGAWTGMQWAVLIGVWFLGFLVSQVVRQFVVQYVGDVAAYISAHTVNKWAVVRNEIQACALEVAEAVYREPAAAGGFAYPHVVVVGHSLGSVVAYDTLNALLVKEALADPPLAVAARTRALITFGSPLDKTAFIFRSQRRKDQIGAREALAAARQPMILDYDHRPARWINIHSPSDWISGSLEYYDDPDQIKRKPQWAQDEKDPEATTPLAAHTEYWRGRLLATRLYEAVTRLAVAPEKRVLEPEEAALKDPAGV